MEKLQVRHLFTPGSRFLVKWLIGKTTNMLNICADNNHIKHLSSILVQLANKICLKHSSFLVFVLIIKLKILFLPF